MGIVSARDLSKLTATLDRLRENIARKLESAAEYSHDSLSHGEAEKQALLQAVPDFVFRIRYDGIVSLVSAGNIRFVPAGISTPGRVSGDPATEPESRPPITRSPEDIARILTNELSRQRRVLVDRAMRTGRVQVVEFQVQHNGQIAYCQARSVAYSRREVLAIVRDITALKVTGAEAVSTKAELEAKINEKTAELEQLKEAAQREALRHAEERQFLEANLGGMEALLAATRAELEAKINEINERTAELEQLKEVLHRETTLHAEEVQLLRTSLSEMEMLLTVTRAELEQLKEDAQREAIQHAEERKLLKADLCEVETLLAAVKVKLEAKINEINEKSAELDQLKEALRRETTLHAEEVRLLRTGLDIMESLLEETVLAISTVVQKRDPYTAGHHQRVSELACAIGREMNLDNDRIRVVRLAALLHDLGKVFIPTEILAKPGRLNPAELSMVRTHPEANYEILKTIGFPGLADIVRQHHERVDGSGYPLGLKGEDILIEAKILAVADVVEAMVSRRPHRLGQNLEEVLEEIGRGRGTLYDPDVVDACTRLFGEGRFSFKQDGASPMIDAGADAPLQDNQNEETSDRSPGTIDGTCNRS